MIRTYNVGTINFELFEWVLIPFLLALAYFIGVNVKLANVGKNNAYRFLLPALGFKIFAGIFFGLIYVFYYGGGDTISYYSSSIPLVRLFYVDFGDFVEIMLNSTSFSEQPDMNYWDALTFNVFTSSETGIPLSFISWDSKTFMVCKLTVPIMILTGSSYFATTIILSALTFIPLWRLYIAIRREFPILEKQLAIGMLFMPSVLFWGSGIMKDTYTFSAVCLAVTAVINITRNRKIYLEILVFLIACFLILSIKPYILNILIPSIGVWAFLVVLSNVKNTVIRFLILPLFLVASLAGSFAVLSSLGGSMDKFALDSAVKTVVVTNKDLKTNEAYGNNKFDIGEIDGSISGMILKFPQATFAGLFRPTLIEAKSPVMFLSAIENIYLLGLFILTIWKVRFKLIYRILATTPLLSFCIIFSVLFAFMLGITTPNFGALVRFKIPLMPFFAAGCIILYNTKKFMSE